VNTWRQRWRALNTAPAFSSKAWLLWAARFALLFLVLHLAGLREDTTVLSGTVNGKSAMVSGFLGLMYLLSYFGAFLLAPPALFAAAVMAAAEYLWRRKHPS
jgi:hypothetical protein